jgi:Zn-dependent protease
MLQDARLCYNASTMPSNKQSLGIDLTRGQMFWLVVGGIFVVYGIMRLGVVSFASIVVSLIVGVTIHECAHAWAADQLGDPTARYMGRVSLNPLVHLDPAGTMMMAVTALTGMGIGWGKPVPVSPHRLRYGSKLGGGMVSLAGPASNLLLAAVLGLVFRASLAGPLWPSQVLFVVIQTNVVLAVFNLLPLPPLDGFGVLVGVLSLMRTQWAWRVQEALAGLERYGGMILLVILVAGGLLGMNFLGWILGPPAAWLIGLITGIG